MFSKNGPSFFELIHQGLCSTQRGYDLLAPKFDETPFRTPDEMLEHAAQVIGAAEDALDICCGTGAGMKFLRPICRRRLVGIDFSAGMLAQAKQKLAATISAPEVEFIERDIMTMIFREEFDVVTCFGALGHVPPGREDDFLRLIYNALKPGGRFVCYSAHASPLFSIPGMMVRGFDMAMKIRNFVLKPPFVMYYSTLRVPELATKLAQESFAPEILATPFARLHLVMARKSDKARTTSS